MKVKVAEFTSAIGNITDLVSGDKSVPGVLLKIGEDEIKVCYSDGRKSFIRPVEMEREDGDIEGDIVVEYGRITSILANCQSSGRIVVDELQISFEDMAMKIKAEQKCLISSEEDGDEEEYRVMSTKEMLLGYSNPEDSMKTKILSRMNYDAIFDSVNNDEWTAAELADIFGRTSSEKGRAIYMSHGRQQVFTINTAHVTSVPVEPLEVSPLDIESLRVELEKEGRSEDFEKEVAELYKRMKHASVLPSNSVRLVCSILNKLDKESKVYTHKDETHFCVFNDDGIGIWFEVSQGNKAQISQYEKYSSLPYDVYQLDFLREFLEDGMKSAMRSTNSEKLKLSFSVNMNDEVELVLSVVDGSASVVDTYKVVTTSCLQKVKDIEERSMEISLKVFNEMLSKLKTDLVAFDVAVLADGSQCIRLAEVDQDKVMVEYNKKREELGLGEEDYTSDEDKMSYRPKTLGTCQYAMVSK